MTPPEADRQLGISLQISQREGYQDALAFTYRRLSSQAYWQGHFQRALHFGREGLTVSRDIHDGTADLSGLAFLCLASWGLGDYAQTRFILDEGMTKAKERGNRFIIGRLTNTLGWLHHDLGDLSHASEYNRKSIELGQASGTSNVEVSALINLGFERVNELKITPCLRRRLELWWQIGGELSSKIGQSHKFKKFNGLKFSELRKKWANRESVCLPISTRLDYGLRRAENQVEGEEIRDG